MLNINFNLYNINKRQDFIVKTKPRRRILYKEVTLPCTSHKSRKSLSKRVASVHTHTRDGSERLPVSFFLPLPPFGQMRTSLPTPRCAVAIRSLATGVAWQI